MINDKELNISNMSYTHKDFYQIYPEILDIVKKISNRWDPESSNESDPGIVLLKLLGFIADKQNYNIDKNILEAFMPSATQQISMRNLCDMMGYNMSYYKSATTDLTFMYQGDLASGDSFTLPAYTTSITNEDGDMSYILLEPITITSKNVEKSVSAIEGQYCNVTVGDSNVITLANLDDNNRLYLPESMIPENGVFVQSVADSVGLLWDRVDNLNTQIAGKYVYKFGFDSYEKLPYIQFPDDISNLIEDGLYVNYVRTKGADGNVSAKVLTNTSGITNITSSNDNTITIVDEEGIQLLVCTNVSASINGANYETLDDAYNGFKKTIGTFDTLVTCRDYANAIYNLVSGTDNTSPLVSNVIVSDIRDDLDRCDRVVSLDEYGLNYVDVAKQSSGVDLINHFDLYLYPFKPIRGSYTKSSYKQSFKPYYSNNGEIESDLDEYKSLAHKFNYPDNSVASTDNYCIKNKYDLKAKITTTYKVNIYEENEILNNIYTALYKKFNLRNIDFGDAIPFDTILTTIENADSRIKNVSLEEPEIKTYLMKANGTELDLYSSVSTNRSAYINLLTKNILVGSVPLFNYDKDIEYNYTLCKSTNSNYSNIKYGNNNGGISKITKLVTSVTLPVSSAYTLRENEVAQFIAPNFISTMTYSSYVNYHWTGSTISADTEYKLANNDILYINYKDSNGNVQNIKYTATQLIVNGVSKTVPICGNIIKPNFNLLNSSTQESSTSYTKTSGYDTTWGIAGMFTLSSNEQIEIRDIVETELTKPTYCYWLIKDGTIPFDTDGVYILQNNEYFFYTNDAKTELVTLGSGTKLKKSNASAITFNIDYTKSKVNIDDVASSGLRAFEDTPWHLLQFTKEATGSSGSSLVLQESQIVTLIEGDVINSCTVAGTSSTLTSSLKNVTACTYTIDGVQYTLPTFNISGVYWQGYSRLDLNIGPSLMQKLLINQSVALYNDTTLAKTISGANASNGKYGVVLMSNYLIQTQGGSVDTTVTNLQGVDVDDFCIWIMSYKNSTYLPPSSSTPIELNMSTDDFTKIELSSMSQVDFRCCLTSDEMGIVTIYYIKGDSVTTGAQLKSYSSNTTTANTFLVKYNSTDTVANTITLSEGINIIKVASSSGDSCELRIDRNDDTKGALLIRNVSTIFDKANEGVNYNMFGIATTDVSSLLSSIKTGATVSSKDIFYYNNNVDASTLIDSNDMTDPNVWYDYNNICNKFVVSELDADKFSGGIVLAKSSKL